MENSSIAQECVISLLKSMREELPEMNRKEVSLFLKELDEIIGDMKGIVDTESALEESWREIENCSKVGTENMEDVKLGSNSEKDESKDIFSYANNKDVDDEHRGKIY